jgi:hypothetical protein
MPSSSKPCHHDIQLYSLFCYIVTIKRLFLNTYFHNLFGSFFQHAGKVGFLLHYRFPVFTLILKPMWHSVFKTWLNITSMTYYTNRSSEKVENKRNYRDKKASKRNKWFWFLLMIYLNKSLNFNKGAHIKTLTHSASIEENLKIMFFFLDESFRIKQNKETFWYMSFTSTFGSFGTSGCWIRYLDSSLS